MIRRRARSIRGLARQLGLWALLALLLSGACSPVRLPAPLPGPVTGGHCPLGAPRDGTARPLLPLTRAGYALGYSGEARLALWVCERLEPDQLVGATPRRNRFRVDPLLPEAVRARLEDYRGSGWDRGHLAAAANQAADVLLKDETFYLSNMAPQAPGLNRRIWKVLEQQVRTWARDRGGVWVITGPVLALPGAQARPAAIGGGVALPVRFFKIVVGRGADGRLEALAFLLDNRAYERPYDLAAHLVSVDEVERQTGLDFLPELTPVEERRLEAAPAPLW